MATLAPLSTPRRPFGILNDSKLRNLQSIKNRQNALTPHSAPNLKRRAPSPELSDSENVDPNLIDSIGKRKRAAFDDDVSLSKPSRYSVHVIPAPSKPAAHQQSVTTISTPKIDTTFQKPALPLSAPAAAGRSPTRATKRLGLLKPRHSSSLGSHSARSSSSASLSLAAALQGTLANKRAKKVKTIQESKPASWTFDIFEESEEVQDYRMNEWSMTQSATILDISDDEKKAQEKTDRGKENVDPNSSFNAPAPISRRTPSALSLPSSSSKDLMTEDLSNEAPRTPLGDLNASEFYGEGLDATSVVLVHDDVDHHQDQNDSLPTQPVPESKPESTTPFTFSIHPDREEEDEQTSIATLLATSTPSWPSEPLHPTTTTIDTTTYIDPTTSFSFPSSSSSTDIEIWESESAKDETEIHEDETSSAHLETPLDEAGGFALQEL